LVAIPAFENCPQQAVQEGIYTLIGFPLRPLDSHTC
jgi:hypothetical protein